MKLIFELSRPGRGNKVLVPHVSPTLDPEADSVPVLEIPAALRRKSAPRLPEVSENDLSRHYNALARRSFGVCDGFYPLGSCTMKYNPKINEVIASFFKFTDIHPLQPKHTAAGCETVYALAEKYLCGITGMDAMTFQPAAGAHGEFTGVLLIKAYHQSRGDTARKKIIVPDSAHGTNPATAAMCGFEVCSIASTPDGMVDLDALRSVVGPDTAGLMLTNPNTVGKFDKN
ncbi:MAG: aminomethyl-transferring glycine dehydrogenase subunit GcvPB, partial [Clostridiales bacterium]|nr:aminomethyl-transferring glycine dehydrogenase subunit GcvPB [Clostridiales bacterium]